MTKEERIELILEGTNRASAIIQQVRKDTEALKATTDQAGKSSAAAGKELDNAAATGGRLRQSASAMSSIAFAAEQAKLGTRGTVMAMGSLAEAAAMMSRNANFAAWASGIGAGVIALGSFVSLLQEANRAAEPTALFLKRIENQTEVTIGRTYAAAREARQQAMREMEESVDSFWARMLHKREQGVTVMQDFLDTFGISSPQLRALQLANVQEEKAFERRAEIEKSERSRLATLSDQTRELIRQKEQSIQLGELKIMQIRHAVTSTEMEKAQAAANFESANQQVRAMFRRRDAQGNLVGLTREEVAARDRLLALNLQLFNLSKEEAEQRRAQSYSDTKTQMSDNLELLRAEVGGASSVALRRMQINQELSRELVNNIRLYEGYEGLDALQKDTYAVARARKQLLEEEIGLLNLRTGYDVLANSDDVYTAFEARMELIELEKNAQIKAGVDVEIAAAAADVKREQARRDTFKRSISDIKTMTGILIESKSSQLRAIGHAAESMRRLVIGAEGAYNAVLAAREGAAAIGATARGNWASAALHGAAAANHAAAAAIAGQEALGGGRAAGSVSGGGGGVPGDTFTPSTAGSGGGTTINLIMRDGTGREAILHTISEIERTQMLDVPIPVSARRN